MLKHSKKTIFELFFAVVKDLEPSTGFNIVVMRNHLKTSYDVEDLVKLDNSELPQYKLNMYKTVFDDGHYSDKLIAVFNLNPYDSINEVDTINTQDVEKGYESTIDVILDSLNYRMLVKRLTQ